MSTNETPLTPATGEPQAEPQAMPGLPGADRVEVKG